MSQSPHQVSTSSLPTTPSVSFDSVPSNEDSELSLRREVLRINQQPGLSIDEKNKQIQGLRNKRAANAKAANTSRKIHRPYYANHSRICVHGKGKPTRIKVKAPPAGTDAVASASESQDKKLEKVEKEGPSGSPQPSVANGCVGSSDSILDSVSGDHKVTSQVNVELQNGKAPVATSADSMGTVEQNATSENDGQADVEKVEEVEEVEEVEVECAECKVQWEQQEREDEAEATIAERIASFGGRFPGKDEAFECSHYKRKCWLKADCCNKYYPCRRCHDALEDHNIDRHATKLVGCTLCGAEDVKIGQNCEKCGVQFARYYCHECRFLDDDPEKNIYHCSKCKICRVGKGVDCPDADNYHCDKCNTCVPIEVATSHPCTTRSLECNCPVCSEYMATCTAQVVFMRCGHAMHHSCFEQYTASSYTCPICLKSLTDMRTWYDALDKRLANELLPALYSNKKTEVLCHDCEQQSVVKWHFVFHKCGNDACGGYNTRVLSYPNEAQAAALEAVYSPSSTGSTSGVEVRAAASTTRPSADDCGSLELQQQRYKEAYEANVRYHNEQRQSRQ